jgi:Choline/Carnitine o-acyltransferase
VKVLDSRHRPCLTERELLTNLQAIVADADKTLPNQVAQGAVGVLSTENRKVWASMRDMMARDPNNKVRNTFSVATSGLPGSDVHVSHALKLSIPRFSLSAWMTRAPILRMRCAP